MSSSVDEFFRLKEFQTMFTLIKLGLYEEFERFKALCDSRIQLRSNQIKRILKTTKKKTKSGKKSERKDSKSTRRSSGDLSEEEQDRLEDEKRRHNFILDKIYHEVSESMLKQKAEIKDLLKVRAQNPFFH